MFNRKLVGAGLASLIALLATGANAHQGGGAMASLATGGLHPFSGLDHVLAMIGIGLWGAQIGGRALWALPAAFVGALVIGALVGLNGTGLPVMEIGIAGSVGVLGLAIVFAHKIPAWAGFALAGLVGLLHGHAHGVEMPAPGSATSYIVGFVGASLAL
ncbi:MAG: HupE/UreJ family protein, partial [Alphaproteobacteria bacterium]|nr:HupE/UreJ family protein [Alphaproteobacteria bacterium]